MVGKFLIICADINCQISEEKTEWGSNMITFLGVLLNWNSRTLVIPLEKRKKALDLIHTALNEKKVTIKFVQKLTSTLNFLNRVIVLGRAFTKGMYCKLKVRNKNGQLLKQHHHVNLGKDFMEDCKMWKIFLQNADARQLCRPFVDFSSQSTSSQIVSFTSDASRGERLGMGAVFNDQWLFAQWPEHFIERKNPSIEFLELFALTAGLLAWRNSPQFLNRMKP